jgi:hypothetical protein
MPEMGRIGAINFYTWSILKKPKQLVLEKKCYNYKILQCEFVKLEYLCFLRVSAETSVQASAIVLYGMLSSTMY